MAGSTQAEIPSQLGRTAVVTGATGGLGYETALALAKAGSEVILTGRDDRKGQSAIEKISREVTGAKVATNISIWPALHRSPTSRSGCRPGIIVRSFRGRRRPTDPVRGDEPGGKAGRLLRTRRNWRVARGAGSRADHATGARRGSGCQRLGCFRETYEYVVRIRVCPGDPVVSINEQMSRIHRCPNICTKQPSPNSFR